MMSSYCTCCFLLLTLFGRALFSKKILVHRGEFVHLFENVDNLEKEVPLYINVDKFYTLIVTWTIENETIKADWNVKDYPEIFMDPNGDIWISGVGENYEGNYSILNSSCPEVELIVLVPLTVSIDNGETIFQPMGNNVTITCSVSGSGTINVVWIGPLENTLTNNTKYTVALYDINTFKSTLTIFAISASDSGSYICRATDGSGSAAQDSIALTAYVPLTVSIDNGETLSRPVDSYVTITCTVSGSGTLSIVWIGPFGKALTSNTKYTVTLHNIYSGKSALTIFALSSADSGLYTCQATDEFRSTAQDYIMLSAYVPLSVSIDNGNNVTGVSGGSTTITCSVLGTGTITVTWIGPLGNILSCGTKYTMSSYYYNTGKMSLTIQSQSMSDVGTYTCQTSDNNTQLEDSIYITTAVFTAVINEAAIFASVGDNKVMNCSVTGSYLSINWYQENTLLTNGQKYQINQSTGGGSTLSSLTIFSVQYSDATLYACQAVSSIDGVTIASDSVTLSFQDNSHQMESDSLESKNQLMIYIIIIAVQSAILVIMIIYAVLKNRRYCYLWKGGWSDVYTVNIFTELQEEVHHKDIKKGLDDNPVHNKDFELTEDQVQHWLNSHPDFIKKCLEQYETCPDKLPTLDELNVKVKEEWTPTLDELNVKVKAEWTPREDNLQQNVSTLASSDQHAIYYTGNLPTLDELGVTLTDKWTPRENIQSQWMLSHPSSVETDPLLGPIDPTTFQSSGIGCGEAAQ